MKNIKFAVVFYVISIIVPWIFGDCCRHNIVPNILIKRDHYHCMQIGCLVSVEDVTPPSKKDPNCEYWITLDAKNFNRIRGNTFKTVLIDGLEIVHGAYVIFETDSLNGLPRLRYLKIHSKSYILSADIDFDPRVFQAVSNIIHFDYPFYDNDHMKKILPIFTKLEKLTVLENPLDINSQTFINVSSSLRKIQFIAPTGINIYSNTFSPLHGLTELEFAAINFIEPGVFNGLDKLKVLTIWFKSPSIARIPKNVLNSLKNLETLTIKKSDFSDLDRKIKIDKNAFLGLTVKNLDMREIFLDPISEDIFHGLTAENLHIRVSSIASVAFQAFSESKINNLYFWNTTIKGVSDHHHLMSLWGLQSNTSFYIKEDSSASLSRQ